MIRRLTEPPLHRLSYCLGALLLTTLATAAPLSKFQFEGNTVFTTAELDSLVANYVGRELTREDLEDARRVVTLHYVKAGYLNSGAILLDAEPVNGVVRLRIVEGRLTSINLTGNHWLRSSYITNRIALCDGPPLNVNRLKDGLQLLRQDPNIEQINAELRPGMTPGESVLDLKVKDQQPFRVGLQVDNARPPSVDSGELLLLLADRNLTGHGDALEGSYGIAEGGTTGFKFSDWNNIGGSYVVPVTVWDTTVRAYGDRKNYTVVEDPFNSLNINSESYRYGGLVRQPLYRTPNQEFAVAVAFERRHSYSELLGQPFDFPESGSVSGRTDISVLRLSQEWVDRSQQQVLALRSTFNIGLDVFGTTNDGTDRNGNFVTWLGQGQYVRRLFNTQNQLVLRLDGQWTGNELVSLEQFAIGGINSVRGYRENQLVRDRGVFGSVELRLPVLLNKLGAPMVQLAPFFDVGSGQNLGAEGQTETIFSAGIGLLVTPCRRVNAVLYWGYAFKDFKTTEDDPQDLGFDFRVTIDAF
ncbi:MAG: ShlB/FhaC/HecB family hemolysin secretion/activation protein [Verrucomicrobiota bacterium]